MMMIDFHAHIKRDPVSKSYDIEGLLADMEENGIAQRMISTLEGRGIHDQNDVVADYVRRYPDKLLGCAAIDPKADDSVEETRRVAGMREIKAIEFDSWEHGYLPEKMEHNLDPILTIAAERGLPVKIFTGWGPRTMPQQWAKYLRRHRDVTFVFLHIGGIDFGYGSIPFVAENENALFETSGQTELQVLHEAFKRLPIERFVFGSGYPDKFTKCSIDTFDVLRFSDQEKEKLYSGNARRLLKI